MYDILENPSKNKPPSEFTKMCIVGKIIIILKIAGKIKSSGLRFVVGTLKVIHTHGPPKICNQSDGLLMNVRNMIKNTSCHR